MLLNSWIYRSIIIFAGCLVGIMAGTVNKQKSVNEITGIECIVQPFYKYRTDGKPGRAITLGLKGGRLQAKAAIMMECEGISEIININPQQPLEEIELLLPNNAGVKKNCQVKIVMKTGGRELYKTVLVQPKKKWKVYIYPHSHVDIGYTARQETVQQLQIRNIDVAMDIAEKTQHYPQGAPFKWNPEATWVVEKYLQQATPQQKKKFIEAVKKGWIQIDAGHSNSNTSILSDEELLRFFRNCHTIQAATGVPITTMVQVDLPGAGWGLVQAAAQNGVKSIISFPNYYDVRNDRDHKPFYWIAPDGQQRVMFLQGSPYGYGYRVKGNKYGLAKLQTFTGERDRVSTDTPTKNFIDPFIFEETERLEREGNPYDIFAMTWSMADNCLIDADLPEAVKQWNATYAYPKLMIAGAAEIIAAYEKKYSDIIPVFKGDFTEYWTQGLGSDARRVGMSRRAKENLVQAETLWAMLYGTKNRPSKKIYNAWENLLLAAEHTWGFQNQHAPMAKDVEAKKAAYFEEAEVMSEELIEAALQSIKKEGSSMFAVINTLSWSRDGLVTLLAEESKAGDRVTDEKGNEVPSQRLTTGELVFMATGIPALGSKLYTVKAGNYSSAGNMINGNSLQNEKIKLIIDETTGNIGSLQQQSNNREWVSNSSWSLNSYQYLPGVLDGRHHIGTLQQDDNIAISVKENGPLIASLVVKSDAPGCNWLTREVRIIKGQASIEIINTLDKIADLEKEGIHFGFDFKIPGAVTRMDIPLGVMIPEYDQLPTANRNWLTFQRWVDMSNTAYGITWTAVESPIIELGGITGTILDGARQYRLWRKKIEPSSMLFSWPVNNHWGTNFPATQQGIMSFRYYIQLHDAYDPVQVNRFGVEQHRPLIAVATATNPVLQPIVAISNPRVMLSAIKQSRDGKALIVRLRSLSEKEESVTVNWPGGKPESAYLCKADEKAMEKCAGRVTLPAYGITAIRVVLNN